MGFEQTVSEKGSRALHALPTPLCRAGFRIRSSRFTDLFTYVYWTFLSTPDTAQRGNLTHVLCGRTGIVFGVCCTYSRHNTPPCAPARASQLNSSTPSSLYTDGSLHGLLQEPNGHGFVGFSSQGKAWGICRRDANRPSNIPTFSVQSRAPSSLFVCSKIRAFLLAHWPHGE